MEETKRKDEGRNTQSAPVYRFTFQNVETWTSARPGTDDNEIYDIFCTAVKRTTQ